VGLCRQVHYPPAAVRQGAHEAGVAHIAAHEAIARLTGQLGQVGRVTGVGEQVDVQHLNVAVGGKQAPHQRRADESHTARDQDASHMAVLSLSGLPGETAARGYLTPPAPAHPFLIAYGSWASEWSPSTRR